MLKHEFETLAMKKDATVAAVLFNAVNKYYMATDESKQEFVARLFGANNTQDDILYKVASLRYEETRKTCENISIDPKALVNYKYEIIDHYRQCVQYGIEL